MRTMPLRWKRRCRHLSSLRRSRRLLRPRAWPWMWLICPWTRAALRWRSAARLARRRRDSIRQIAVCLWVLAGAILYRVASEDSYRVAWVGGGIAVVALALVVGVIARRRLLATMTLWHVRDGCSPSEAHRRAGRDVARVWDADHE